MYKFVYKSFQNTSVAMLLHGLIHSLKIFTDLSPSSALFEFNDTQRTGCANFSIADDFELENEEKYFLTLTSSSLPENFVLDPDTSTIIIQDNECKQITCYRIYNYI